MLDGIDRKQCTQLSDVKLATPQVFCLAVFFVLPCQPFVKVPVVRIRVCAAESITFLSISVLLFAGKENL